MHKVDDEEINKNIYVNTNLRFIQALVNYASSCVRIILNNNNT